MKRFVVPTIFLLATLAGCQTENSENRSPEELPLYDPIDTIGTPIEPTEKIYKNTGEDFIKGVAEFSDEMNNYLDSLDECPEPDTPENSDTSHCSMYLHELDHVLFGSDEFTAEREQMRDDPTTAKILVIDYRFGGAVIRNAKRMLGMYDWQVEENGDAVTADIVKATDMYVTSPADFQFKKMIARSESFLPNSELTRQLDYDRMGKVKTADNAATEYHGSIILNALADYIPYAQFITLKFYHFPNSVICSNSEETIDSYTDQIITSISNLIDEHDIEYVNLSAGRTRASFFDDINQHCPSLENKILNADKLNASYTRILQAMANKAVLVQAAPNGARPTLTPVLDGDFGENHYSDCVDIPNRLRTGYIAKSYLNEPNLPIIPQGGIPYSDAYLSLLNGTMHTVKSCTDLMINSGTVKGFEDLPYFGDHPILFSIWGGSGSPEFLMTTSFINGLGIAVLEQIHRNQGITPSEALALLKSRKPTTETPYLMDPMRHEELPLCANFPDACRNWAGFIIPRWLEPDSQTDANTERQDRHRR